jgi:hypothetical protein
VRLVRTWLHSIAVLAACGHGGDQPRTEPRSSAPFVEVPLATEPGLSGLAVDATGALWTIAERSDMAYRITLDAELHPTLQRFPVRGVPEGFDLEGIAVLGEGRFAFGTEGRLAGVATILRAEEQNQALVVTGELTISEDAAGVRLEPNHGAEGVCGHGDQIIAVLETAGTDQGRRWAPLVHIVGDKVVRSHRVWLTSPTGKLSGLDCVIDPDGTVRAWAIERHFEVTKLLGFTLAPTSSEPITPTVLLDLAPVLRGKLNLEGIARLPDGRLVAVNDNQWKTLEGESRLLVFPARD